MKITIKEEYKDIKNYEGLYQVSNLGNVKRVSKNRLLTPQKDKYGYLHVSLSKNNKVKIYKVHRLVADTFIENKNNYKQINHKDEDKLNNNVNNLEWCNSKYNCNYGNRNNKISIKNGNKGKSIYQIKDNIVIKKWNNIITASKTLNINNKNIVSCCKNKRKSAGGYQWIYESDYTI